MRDVPTISHNGCTHLYTFPPIVHILANICYFLPFVKRESYFILIPKVNQMYLISDRSFLFSFLFIRILQNTFNSFWHTLLMPTSHLLPSKTFFSKITLITNIFLRASIEQISNPLIRRPHKTFVFSFLKWDYWLSEVKLPEIYDQCLKLGLTNFLPILWLWAVSTHNTVNGLLTNTYVQEPSCEVMFKNLLAARSVPLHPHSTQMAAKVVC